jgi:glycosyltransferase involved in cell wall biosynthesis
MDQRSITSIEDLHFPYSNYVLALPGWYPTWQDPLPGDFNQRHILAASLYMPQIVLYIGKDPTGNITTIETRYNQLRENVIEICVLYPQNKVRVVDVLESNIYFLRLLFRYAALIQSKWGKPALLHSYIVIRGGVAGWLLGKKWKLPFVLTENWTIYYPEDPGYLPQRNMVFRWVVKQVFNSVATFLPVTNNLNNKASKLLHPVPFVVVPNVVDTSTFYLQSRHLPNTTFRFIHVSTMTYQKNPEGLLRGFSAFAVRYTQASLTMVGPYDTAVKEYALSLGLSQEQVHFTGAVSYKEVAALMHSAHALVLFSRFENLPCVILEAFCCGMPVVSTRVGGIDEVINAANGILLDNGDEAALLQALVKVYEHNQTFNTKKIAESAMASFSYQAIGEKINTVYQQYIKS